MKRKIQTNTIIKDPQMSANNSQDPKGTLLYIIALQKPQRAIYLFSLKTSKIKV